MRVHNKKRNQEIKTIKGTAILLAVIILGIVIVKFCVDLLLADDTVETSKYVDTDTVTWVASFTVSNGVAVYDTDSNGEIIKVPVPAGYTPSIIEGETSIKTGFVIYEGDSSIWATYGVGSSAATSASLDYDEEESEGTGSEEGTGSAEGEEDIENTAQEEQSNENVSENINETLESENQVSATANDEDGTGVSGTTYSENVKSGTSESGISTMSEDGEGTGTNGTSTAGGSSEENTTGRK